MTFPRDADGDALRRVAAGGADMGAPMSIDFSVAAPSKEAAEGVAAAAQRLGYRTDVWFDDEEQDLDGDDDTPPWTCYCTKSMLATYEGVIRAQRELDEIGRPFGAWSDGWGTYGNAGAGEQDDSGANAQWRRLPGANDVKNGPAALLVADRCNASGREAHVAEEVDSIWLYLTLPGSPQVDTDVWLLNTPAAPAAPCQEPYRSQAAPPPLPAELLLPGGARPVPAEGRWRLLWSEDGLAVAALLDGKAIGFVRAGTKRGRARFVRYGADSWALPWDSVDFGAVFREQAQAAE